MAARAPDERLDRWLRLALPATRTLAIAVRAEVVAPLLSAGFAWVSKDHHDPTEPVPAREIVLERQANTHVETITLAFDKYLAPRLQFRLARRAAAPPHSWVRAANVVQRRGQLFSWWGKPGWLPMWLWSMEASQRTARNLAALLPAALAFLEHGTPSRNLAVASIATMPGPEET